MNKNLKWLTIALSAILIGAAAAGSLKEYFYPTNGSFTTIGVKATWLNGTEVTTINWGKVDNGTAYIFEPINITNTKEIDATLTLTTKDKSASLTSLTLTWNYTGAVLKPNDWVIVELTQTVTGTGDWSYTTVITATEA